MNPRSLLGIATCTAKRPATLYVYRGKDIKPFLNMYHCSLASLLK